MTTYRDPRAMRPLLLLNGTPTRYTKVRIFSDARTGKRTHIDVEVCARRDEYGDLIHWRHRYTVGDTLLTSGSDGRRRRLVVTGAVLTDAYQCTF